MKKVLLWILIVSLVVHVFALVLTDHSAEKSVRVSTWSILDYVLDKGSDGYFDFYDPLSGKEVNFFEFTSNCLTQVQSLFNDYTDSDGNVTSTRVLFSSTLNAIYKNSVFSAFDQIAGEVLRLFGVGVDIRPLYTVLTQIVRLIAIICMLAYFVIFTVYFVAIVILRFVQLFVDLVSLVQFV